MGRFGWTSIAALLPMTANAAGSDHDPNYIARISMSVVKIHAHSSTRRTSLGSGVFVAPGEVVTNCHVTRNAESIEVRKGGIWVNAEAQQANVARDLCLLTVPRVPLPPAPLRSVKDVSPGQVVYSIGFPGGAGSIFASGRVHSLHTFDGSKVIETTTGFNLGASGGALFDDSGRLLGITTFRARGSRDSHFYAIPADWIEDLRSAPRQRVAPLSGDVLPFWGETRARQPYFLQAAPLEAEQDWNGLHAVAELWAKDDQDDADAWYFLGRANAKLGRSDVAVVSLQRAVRLNAEYGRAWLELGLLYARLGRSEDVERVRVSLSTVDEDLEQEFLSALGDI
jgi:serine protease Do